MSYVTVMALGVALAKAIWILIQDIRKIRAGTYKPPVKLADMDSYWTRK